MLISLAKYLIDPFNILWILLLLCIGCWYFKKERLSKWLAISAGLWFLLISTPLLPNLILNSLEDRYTPLFVDKQTNNRAEFHIIVLGAGHMFNDRLPANSLLSHDALLRLNEGIRLHRQLPGSELILSGYSTVGNITGAEMLKRTAMLLGIKEESIILQKDPVNTYEEAKIYAQNYGNSNPVILVTSAVHMPRAMRIFLEQGIDPVPSPTNYRLNDSRKDRWIGLPDIDNIKNLKVAIYEYIGILYYDLIY